MMPVRLYLTIRNSCIAFLGPYSNGLSHVGIPKRSIGHRMCCLVPPTYHTGVHAQLRLIVYSTVSRIGVDLRSS
ncbi:hypothetical protein EDB19DRAFT_1689336 [Suillus lakei]|nr:hypothetical protein EDB19DRAFT_1689336 [Suillus lakei]